MLVLYGIIILLANIPALSSPAGTHIVLADLHAGLWWGIVLLLLGILFLFLHWPSKRPSAPDEKKE